MDEGIHGDSLKRKSIVIIVPSRLFHETEYEWLREIFEREGAKIIVSSSTLSGAYGASGKEVKPEILVKNIVVEEIDAVVFIGGAGCLQYLPDYSALNLVKKAVELEKILAAIHQAPRILAEAGVLIGKNTTCTTSASSYLKDRGAIVTGNDVECDGSMITAIGPSTAKQFGEAIVSALSE